MIHSKFIARGVTTILENVHVSSVEEFRYVQHIELPNPCRTELVTKEEDEKFYGRHLTTYSNGTVALHAELFVQGHEFKMPSPSKPVKERHVDMFPSGFQTVNHQKDKMSVHTE